MASYIILTRSTKVLCLLNSSELRKGLGRLPTVNVENLLTSAESKYLMQRHDQSEDSCPKYSFFSFYYLILSSSKFCCCISLVKSCWLEIKLGRPIWQELNIFSLKDGQPGLLSLIITNGALDAVKREPGVGLCLAHQHSDESLHLAFLWLLRVEVWAKYIFCLPKSCQKEWFLMAFYPKIKPQQTYMTLGIYFLTHLYL